MMGCSDPAPTAAADPSNVLNDGGANAATDGAASADGAPSNGGTPSDAGSDASSPDDAAPSGVPGWNLVFSDDFDTLNTKEWFRYDSPGHANNGLRRPEAVTVDNGLLVLTATMKSGSLVSGGMSHGRNYTYGRFEFRVRTEPDPSQATSGVVLTWPQSEKWPVDGENDIYETGTGAKRDAFDINIHYGADNQVAHSRQEVDATAWHVIAMEWEAKELRVYRDGPLVWTLKNVDAIPDVPHHLCIQLDAFAKTMTGTVRMYVDWVRIYQR